MLIGNLSRDPVIRVTTTGATVCTFGIATNAAWKNEGGELQERTEFHNIVGWNKLAEICAQILAVGMLVYIEGELRTRSWDDENGIRHFRSEVRISDMKLLDSKGKAGIGLDAARQSSGSKTERAEETTKEATKEIPKEKAKEEDEKKEKKEEKSDNDESSDDADLPF